MAGGARGAEGAFCSDAEGGGRGALSLLSGTGAAFWPKPLAAAKNNKPNAAAINFFFKYQSSLLQ
jgi:hypothetical protein